MRRKINFSIGEYYHIYNRGTDKRVIFMEHNDNERFQALLYICNSTKAVDMNLHFHEEGRAFYDIFDIERGDTLVDIGAYCHMPNHFHLLIREKTEGGIIKFMSKLSIAYAMYFNKKNGRTGCLFEGPFKAKHVDSDVHLKYLFAYIHLNPIKIIDPKWRENGISNRTATQDYLNNYEYSSHPDYQGVMRLENKILHREAFPEYFTTYIEFNDFINEWLSFSAQHPPKSRT